MIPSRRWHAGALLVGALTLLVLRGASVGQGEPEAPRPLTSREDLLELEQNLRFLLARERQPSAGQAQVGVYADLGAWHPSVRSVVTLLEGAGVPCLALDRTLLTATTLRRLEALVFPGGWAPHQRDTLGPDGHAAVRAFAERGGRVLGICAGAYLLSATVRWDGERFAYPLALFDGEALGPLGDVAPWPQRAPVRLDLTRDAEKRGWRSTNPLDVLYFGGPSFEGGTDIAILARYPSGKPAAISRPVGKGEVILFGPHLERPAPAAGGDDAPPPAPLGATLRALLLRR